VLARGDVLLAVDGKPVAQDGTVELREGGERIDFNHMVTSKMVGSEITLDVKRDGKRMPLKLTLHPNQRLVRAQHYSLALHVRLGGPGLNVGRAHPPQVPMLDQVDASPSYLIICGLVFCPLSVPALQSIMKESAGGLGASPQPAVTNSGRRLERRAARSRRAYLGAGAAEGAGGAADRRASQGAVVARHRRLRRLHRRKVVGAPDTTENQFGESGRMVWGWRRT
jgi:hypothetical protein